MPGSFNNLQIDSDGHLSPDGPLEINPGDEDLEIYAWVAQEGAFITCEGEPTNDGKAWATKSGTAEHKGRFVPGQAWASGTITAENGGKSTVEWWNTTIQLT